MNAARAPASPRRRRILVTSALPYANGPIHIGHLVEYVQADVWVRFQRMRGAECHFVCADDAHGTPIMLSAEREGVSPEALIERIGAEHRADFAAFHIGFDDYHTTHSPENRECSERIYRALRANGHVTERTIPRLYDPARGMFLPDRYVRGECPRCGAADQLGDSCEACGATYEPGELRNPVSAVSGASPELRDSEQVFVRLADFEDVLRGWVQETFRPSGAPAERRRVQPEIANKLGEWFADGLDDWDISRNAPYFGFEIPDRPGKYFYVWLDAPIGYMASFQHLCGRVRARGGDLRFEDFWAEGSGAELYHFIGKDIAYFHTLFWPAVLHGAGFRKPTAVFCHGFLTVNGEKMSKRRGTFIQARTYADHLDPEYLRYYFSCKLGSGIDDMDLNFEDFVTRVNADLVGKVVNIASRCARFVTDLADGRLAAALDAPELFERFAGARGAVAEWYETREYGRAMREVMALADLANRYIDEHKPWVAARAPEGRERAAAVCSTGLELFRVLVGLLKPVLPATAGKAERFLGIPPLAWDDLARPLAAGGEHRINRFEPLLTRVDRSRVEAVVEASRER